MLLFLSINTIFHREYQEYYEHAWALNQCKTPFPLPEVLKRPPQPAITSSPPARLLPRACSLTLLSRVPKKKRNGYFRCSVGVRVMSKCAELLVGVPDRARVPVHE
eukprot:28412-Hanusia_phi.AAC.18